MSDFETKAAELINYIDLLVARFVRVQAASSEAFSHINKQDVKVVLYLGKHGPSRMSEIATHMQLVSSAITAIVDRLVDAGLLERFRSPEDRRVVKVELSRAGWEIHKIELENFLNLSRDILNKLNENEQDQLLHLIGKIQSESTSSG